MHQPVRLVRNLSFVVVTLIMTLSFQRSASAIDGTPTWLYSPVGAPPANMFISSPSLAFDHYGVPSVAWSVTHNTGVGNTVYRSNTSGLGFWTHHTVEATTGAGILTSLSFDRSERPTVAWVNGDGVVKTLFNNTTLQTIAASGANVNRPALTISHDLTGTLRGIYSTQTAGGMMGFSGANGSHTTGSLGTLPGVSNVFDLRLTTDHTGRRHAIAGARLTSGANAVIVASEPISGGSWTSSILATADDVKGVAIATSPTDGKIALAYTTLDSTTNTSRLMYAKSTGTMLVTTQVQSSTTAVFEDIDLAFDRSDGRPAIAYEQKVTSPFAQQIQFAYMNASSVWQTSLIDATASLDNAMGLPRRPSLAFDDYGTSWPAVAYIDADGSLMVAFDPPGAAPEPAALALLAMCVFPLARRRRA
ncbi:MAG: hypothetical protein KF841_11885 [Phycisphaerae bacterium]|nr:hypothetical protein [Phycisphaerae bacterium]